VTEPFTISSISELVQETTADSPRWAPVRLHFDITAFGVNAWVAKEDGQTVINEHDELGPPPSGHEELYFVATGHATFTVAGDEIDAPAGTFVFVKDPAAKRKAVAREAGTTVLATGGVPGEAFVPMGWERSSHALRHWATRDFDKAVEELSELHAQHPEEAGLVYNLACAESTVGRKDEALGHLREAIALNADLRKLAEEDSDLEAIRDDPRFASAVAGEASVSGSST
jgi:tetratricopeptide (TPR) repeat protein